MTNQSLTAHEHSQRLIESAKDNTAQFEEHPELQNSMLYWYPRITDAITDLPAIDTPDTLFVDIERINIHEVVQEADEPLTDAKIDSLAQCPANWSDDLVKQAADELGYPAFIRTDTDSAKHDMTDGSKIRTNTIEEVHDTVDALIRATANNGGLGPRFNCLAVREWIDIDASFEAFGGTPIGPEIRVFVRDGDVDCHHFYWPFNNPAEHNITGTDDVAASVAALEETTEQAMNDSLREAAAHISTHLDGYWSLDFALTTDDTWHIIDAARGDDSWHPDACEHVADDEYTDRVNDLIEEHEDTLDQLED